MSSCYFCVKGYLVEAKSPFSGQQLVSTWSHDLDLSLIRFSWSWWRWKIFASTQPLGSESADDVVARVSQFLPPGPLETCSFQTRIKMFDLESLSSIQYVAALGLGVGGEYLRSSVKVERAKPIFAQIKKTGQCPVTYVIVGKSCMYLYVLVCITLKGRVS